MNSLDAVRTILAADGYAYLGLSMEAWALLGSLPPDVRSQPRVIAVKLIVCALEQKWRMGTELAKAIGSGNPLREREAAGRFRLAHAISLCTGGDMQAARESIALMCEVWPEGQEEARQDRGLDALWKRGENRCNAPPASISSTQRGEFGSALPDPGPVVMRTGTMEFGRVLPDLNRDTLAGHMLNGGSPGTAAFIHGPPPLLQPGK